VLGSKNLLALSIAEDRSLYIPIENTIYALIVKSISEVERDSIDPNVKTFLRVSFNLNGEIESIGFDHIGCGWWEVVLDTIPQNINEAILFRHAQKVLKGFPKLEVDNEWYYSPNIVLVIWFDGYCLKNPNNYWCANRESHSTAIYFLMIGFLAIGNLVLSIFPNRQISKQLKL
jgi:hypothetical protein